MVLWMAPMLGFTEQVFRNTFVKHFGGLDAAITPFITLVEGKKIKERHLKDLFPEVNQTLKIIPQVIGNKSDQFVLMNRYLLDMGYREVNWNLGCPAPRVAGRKRGSGLLPYPEMIESVLNTIFQQPHPEISVKIRLGYQSPLEINQIVPILNRYPLQFVAIHPRIGTQLYEGKVDLDTFERVVPQINHRMIYSGDIFTLSDFEYLQQRFPEIHDFMLGRGILRDPFLPEKIRGNASLNDNNLKQRFESFCTELFHKVVENSTFEPNALNKTKEYWTQFSTLYQNSTSIFNRIKVVQNVLEMENVLFNIFNNESFKN